MKKTEGSFWEHLEELRHLLLKSIFLLAGLTFVFFIFSTPLFKGVFSPLAETTSSLNFHKIQYQEIINPSNTPLEYPLKKNQNITDKHSKQFFTTKGNKLLLPPKSSAIITYKKPLNSLVILTPTEGITCAFKLSIWSALILGFPAYSYWLLSFALPAIKKATRKHLVMFSISSILLMGIGLLFSIWVTIPISNAFLFSFNVELGDNMWGLSSYLNYTLFLCFANALVFEMLVVLFFLVEYGVITARWLQKQRKAAIICIFLIAALLTPPDIFTQLLLAIPMIFFYEMVILWSKIRKRALLTRIER